MTTEIQKTLPMKSKIFIENLICFFFQIKGTENIGTSPGS